MATAGRLPPIGEVRSTAFVATFRFRGIDLTGAILHGQVRLTAEAPGDPIIDLPTVATVGVTGFRLAGATIIDGVMTSLVTMTIAKADMAKLPAGAEIDQDAEFAWDLHITPAGGVEQRRLYGPFIAYAGVTR